MTYTITQFITDAKATVVLITDGIAIFMDPPLVWFVAMGAMAAGIGIAKRLIPKKRAR